MFNQKTRSEETWSTIVELTKREWFETKQESQSEYRCKIIKWTSTSKCVIIWRIKLI